MGFKNLKAIIFDFDGVIVESMDIKANAFAFIFRDYPQYTDEIVKFHLKHGGLPRIEKIDRIYNEILKQSISKQQNQRLCKEFSEFVFQQVVKCPYVVGAHEFIEKYYQEYAFFIVSGTPEPEIMEIVKQRGLSKYFVEVLGSPRKKSLLNKYLMQKYKYSPHEVVFVGDSIDDWEGARDVGIRFVARIVENSVLNNVPVFASISNLFDLERILYEKT